MQGDSHTTCMAPHMCRLSKQPITSEAHSAYDRKLGAHEVKTLCVGTQSLGKLAIVNNVVDALIVRRKQDGMYG